MSSKSASLTPSEQAKLLENSLHVIKQQIAQMRKCLDQKNMFMHALKHASTFLSELRTSQLTPKQYYELYINVYDGLEFLTVFLKDNHPNNHLADLYELVQYSGNIVPRLYLMVTVGSVYMSVSDAPIKEIMKDMVEMCRGVQHPIRGLFLRYYLSQRTKNLLPTQLEKKDTSSSATVLPDRGNLDDSIQFIITNFIEMNKLWVRLQHQGHSSERNKRTEERKQLQILVGSNLVSLSQLDAIDKFQYKSTIVPRIFEQITQCKDVIAQEYLLDVVIQVFPDEFHLYTLDDFFEVTLRLHENVSLKKILITLIDRLIAFKFREPDVVDKLIPQVESLTVNKSEGEISKDNVEGKDESSASDQVLPKMFFFKFIHFINKINELLPDIAEDDYAAILESVCKLSIAYYPENFENINCIFRYAADKYKERHPSDDGVTNDGPTLSDTAENNWKLLLLAPINNYDNVKSVIELSSDYEKFLELQSTSIKNVIALEFMDKLSSTQTKITTLDEIKKIFQILAVIITPKKQGLSSPNISVDQSKLLFGSEPNTADVDNNESEATDSTEVLLQQERLAKLLHLIYVKSPYKQLDLLIATRSYLSKGGVRIKYTFPTLIQIVLKLIRKLYILKLVNTKEQKLKIHNVFKFIAGVINEMLEVSSQQSIPSNVSGRQPNYVPLLSLNLNIIAAQLADEIELTDISYEFFIESFIIYEQYLLDSKSQYQALVSIISKLHDSKNLITMNIDNYDVLITKAALYGSKLLKKSDQCRAVYLASHLWWVIEEQEQDVPEEEGEAQGEEEILPLQISLKKDNKRVLECLQKSLRIADSSLDSNVSLELFIEILNRSLYYFIHGNELVTIKYINGLIELIQNTFKSISSQSVVNSDHNLLLDNSKGYFNRTLDYITEQKNVDERFQEITF